MSISRDEFLRTLPAALGASEFAVAGDVVCVRDGTRLIEIEFSEQTPLRVGSLTLPAARVELRFEGYNEEEIAQAAERFDLYFRRGGG